MSDVFQTISEALAVDPLGALRHYDRESHGPEGESVILRYGATMDLIRVASQIESKEKLRELPRHYAVARKEDRRRMLAAGVDQLVALALAVEAEAAGGIRQKQLREIGEELPRLVLEGALEQQLCCKLATALAVPRFVQVPDALQRWIITPLIAALIDVLRLGAPATRDAAIEGLGAILKLAGGDPSSRFPLEAPLDVVRVKGEIDEKFAARVRISHEYCSRLERRRLVVLTVAGHPRSRDEYCAKLAKPIAEMLAALRQDDVPSWSAIEDVLYGHADLLRVLPAVTRQGQDQPRLPANPAGLLCAAARVLTIGEDAPAAVVIAFARFQESVFRTIDTALRRKWKWTKFDEVVAAAVRAIPQVVAGSPAVCNAQIRSTVAVLRTAVRLLKVSRGESAHTRKAVAPLFASLHAQQAWANPGIAEGCYRGLPDLVGDSAHDGVTGPALATLFQHLERPADPNDLVATHRHLIASSCFRRMLSAVTDHGRERNLVSKSDHAGRAGAALVDQHVRTMLRRPDARTVRRICQHETEIVAGAPAAGQGGVAAVLIAGIAFERELLSRSAEMLERWDEAPTIDKIFFTRILAAQLHSISRDMPELARHQILRRLFLETDTVSMPETQRMDLVWKLLSSLPAGAAETADLEVQRFVEYRGWKAAETAEEGVRINDLPGYVLAMIHPEASSRLAAAIAREIDLNLRLDRSRGRKPDFAQTLHEVMLRGPHESIFDHLLPRVREPDDRATVLLFRKHVATVLHTKQHGDQYDLRHILEDLRDVRKDLRRQTSPTLQKLSEVLSIFSRIARNRYFVWEALDAGKLVSLFATLDHLARHEARRKPLLPQYRRRLENLRDEVAHYLTLPVGSFAARKEALTNASDIACDIERALAAQDDLQPPERILLIALMQHLRDLFARTIRRYCDEAQRRKDRRYKDHFWLFFCDPRQRRDRMAASKELLQGHPGRSQTIKLQELEEDDQLARLKAEIGDEPPRFKGQREKFEEYFVHWMASDLDVDALQKRLSGRWPRWFRGLYWIITRFVATSLLIIVPCAIAVWMDEAGYHEWEGAGFFVVTVAAIAAAIFSLTPIIHAVAKRWRRNKREKVKPGYWFPSLLPRLARLIAVPMALIVELDHSYDFPLHGSTWVLLLLIGLSFVTTTFVARREIVDRMEQPGQVEVTPDERASVWRIVAIALAHSFGIAVLLSAIFSSSHKPKLEKEPSEPEVQVIAGKPSPFWEIPDAILTRFDAVEERYHEHPRFLGVIPREAKLNLGEIAEHFHYPLPVKVAEHATFTFYPTIILTWTALGLFFGVFLEGFLNGERLRGESPEEHRA